MTTKAAASIARVALLAWATTVPNFTIKQAARTLHLTYSQTQHYITQLCATKQLHACGSKIGTKPMSKLVCVYSAQTASELG